MINDVHIRIKALEKEEGSVMHGDIRLESPFKSGDINEVMKKVEETFVTHPKLADSVIEGIAKKINPNNPNFSIFKMVFLDMLDMFNKNPETREHHLDIKELKEQLDLDDSKVDMFIEKKDKALETTILAGIYNTKIFEVNKHFKRLLFYTDTDYKSTKNIHLPFEWVFIDTNISSDELGIESENNKDFNGFLIKELQEGVFMVFTMALESTKDDIRKEVTSFFDYFYITFDDDKEKNVYYQESNKETKDKLKAFVANFITFLSHPEVKHIKRHQSPAKMRRAERKGTSIRNESHYIVLRGRVYDRLQALERSGFGTADTKTIVRGFLRHFWNEEHYNGIYSSHIAGTLEKDNPDVFYDQLNDKLALWVFPFVRGKGEEVNKDYSVKYGKKHKDSKQLYKENLFYEDL
jgi:hypothetical protein